MMKGHEEENILYVRMFGEFSMTWNGRVLTGRSGSGGNQFACLMQLLLHNREQGVDKGYLEEALFAGRDVQDRAHAIRSIIYNARKKLRAACLPGADYIRRQPGGYRWAGEIPVVEDAAEMERLYQEMKEEHDPERRLKLCVDACHCYQGEFLGNQSGSVWAAKEARRYRELFCACMEEAITLLREQKDYIRMEKLGIYATKLYPMANWETVTMEALVSSGRDRDAERFYNDTVSLYLQEQGLRPSSQLTEQLHRLGSQIRHTYAVFDDIQDELEENRSKPPGGYLCSYPVFQGIYQMMIRMLERNGLSVYLMLCTVVDSKGNPVQEGLVLEQMSQRLCEAIQCSIRKSDVLNQYGKGQYLVLLLNTTLENCRILQKRIDSRFQIGRQRIGLQYHVKSVICTPGMRKQVME